MSAPRRAGVPVRRSARRVVKARLSAGLVVALAATAATAFVSVTGAQADSSTPTSAPSAPSSPSSSPTTSPGSGSSGSPDSSGSSGSSSSNLGGFSVMSTGAGVSWYYEQPNFPLPSTPSLELDLGYAQSSYNAGPTGESLASTIWPGSVVANGASQLSLLLQPYLGSSADNLPAPPWPIQAASAYPPGPSTPSTSSQDSPGVTMEAGSSEQEGTATANVGTGGLPSGFVTVQSAASAVQSTVSDNQAVAQATSDVHGVSIAGGLITIGQVTSTATSTSDASQAQESGTSTVSQVSVAGEAATLDSSGLHLVGNEVPVLGSVLPNAQQALQAAGIALTLTNPTDTVNGASGERQLDGVQVKIDLTTLDKQVDQLVAGLPQQLQTQVIDNLPVPPPDSQVLTVDLGWVNVQAAASPGYSAASDSGGGSDIGLGAGSALGSSSGAVAGFGSTGGVGGTAGGGSGGAGGGSPSSGGGLSTVASTTPARLFQGIGAGLIALGVFLALMLAAVLWRADKAVGAMTAGPGCAGETHDFYGGI